MESGGVYTVVSLASKGDFEMQTVKIRDLVLYVAGPPGEEVIMERSRSLSWVIGRFEMSDQWRLEPLTDSTIIPAKARHRKELIEGAGIDVEWYVAHEVMPEIELPQINQKDVELAVKIGLVVLGAVVIISLFPLVLLGLLFACSSGDPALIARTHNEKGEEVWLDCYRWY